MEDPTYFMIHAATARVGMQVLPVPRRADGPDLDTLEAWFANTARVCCSRKPCCINPTGGNTSPQVAHCLLMLAERHVIFGAGRRVYGGWPASRYMRLAQIDGLNWCFTSAASPKPSTPACAWGCVARQNLAGQAD